MVVPYRDHFQGWERLHRPGYARERSECAKRLSVVFAICGLLVLQFSLGASGMSFRPMFVFIGISDVAKSYCLRLVIVDESGQAKLRRAPPRLCRQVRSIV